MVRHRRGVAGARGDRLRQQRNAGTEKDTVYAGCRRACEPVRELVSTLPGRGHRPPERRLHLCHQRHQHQLEPAGDGLANCHPHGNLSPRFRSRSARRSVALRKPAGHGTPSCRPSSGWPFAGHDERSSETGRPSGRPLSSLRFPARRPVNGPGRAPGRPVGALCEAAEQVWHRQRERCPATAGAICGYEQERSGRKRSGMRDRSRLRHA
jgi:hypothetical protein